MQYRPMGLWPRLMARLLAFSSRLIHGYSASHSDRNTPPKVIVAWNEGLYFEWEASTRNTAPFVLLQSGSNEYDGTVNMFGTEHGSNFSCSPAATYEKVDWPSKLKPEGLEVIVPRSPHGQILLAQLVDHITNLVEEWYPGLLKPDIKGRSLFQQYSPCFICTGLNTPDQGVHSFCINDLAESVLCNKKSSVSDVNAYKVKVSSSGILLVYCRFHQDSPVPVAMIAPEINLDDFDASLRLDPTLLDFTPSSRCMLGDGGFGAVYQATYNNENVAIKTFHSTTPDQSYKMLRNELNILAQHQHPSIISLKGFIPPAFSTPNLPLPLLAIEYAKLGSLGKLLCSMCKMNVHARKSALSPSIRHRIAYEVAEGLQFLHFQNIVYRDMKPDNILLTSLSLFSPTIAKITDYGISTLASPSGIPGASGSPGYSAPEVVSLKGRDRPANLFPYSVKCDLYSYGLLLHEVAVGRSPWVDYVYEEHLSDKGTSFLSTQPDEIILKGILPSPISSYEGSISWPYAQNIVTQCLQRNPEDRPTAQQVVSVLSGVQSNCLRFSTPLQPIHPICAKVYDNISKDEHKMQRSISMFVETIKKEDLETPNIEIFYVGSLCDDLTGDNISCVMRLLVDAEGGHVLKDDIYKYLDSNIVVNCFLQLPSNILQGKKSDRRAFVVSTLEHQLLVICSDTSKVSSCSLPSEVTCLHFHQPLYGIRGKHVQDAANCYVLVALNNSILRLYTVDQLLKQSFKYCLQSICFSDVCGRASVSQMVSSGNLVYAACGNTIVSVNVADSGRPSIQSYVQTSLPVRDMAVGGTHLYTSEGDATVHVRNTGEPSLKMSLDTREVLAKKSHGSTAAPEITVTSLFFNIDHPSLWVGLSSGHVIVYSEPRHNPLAVFNRHTGPVCHIFAVEDLVVCLGEGFRAISEDFAANDNEEESLLHARRVSRRSVAAPIFHLTLWDADLPHKANSFNNIIKARQKLL